MRIIIPVLFTLAIFSWGCSKSEEHKEESKIETPADIARDVRVPLKIWDMLAGISDEAHGEKGGHEAKAEHGAEAPAEGGHGGGAAAEGEGKEGAGDDSYIFAEIKVILTEKNPGIIKDKSVTISFPRGGGEVDLANYVTGKPGSFFVKFEYPSWDEAKEKDKKVLFVSHARKRKIDNQIFGSGCRDLYNITDRFVKEMSGEGLKVNTTRNRHTSVLGGTFILSSKKAGQNFLTQVTFTDSGNKNLLCQEN